MVYFERNTNETLIIPRHLQSISRQFNLILVNNLTSEVVSYPNIISTSKNPKLYCFDINTSELLKGEYTYYIKDKRDVIVDSGLCVLSGEEEVKKEYQNEKNTIVYNG